VTKSGTDGLGAADLKCTFHGTEVVSGTVYVVDVDAVIAVIVRFEVWFEFDSGVIDGSVLFNARDGSRIVMAEVEESNVKMLATAVAIGADGGLFVTLDGECITLV